MLGLNIISSWTSGIHRFRACDCLGGPEYTTQGHPVYYYVNTLNLVCLTRPASRQLHGVYIDPAMAGQLVLDCHNKTVEMRRDNVLTGSTATWTKIVAKAKLYANQHGINDVDC